MKKISLMLILTSVSTGLVLSAQEPTRTTTAPASSSIKIAVPARGDDEKAIRALLDEFIRAFNAGDAVAAAATYTETALVVDDQGDYPAQPVGRDHSLPQQLGDRIGDIHDGGGVTRGRSPI